MGAHITAAAPGGPRFDRTLTAEQRSSVENGIWLCGRCARLIDNDDITFTSDLLRRWKAQAIEVARAEQLAGAAGLTPVAVITERRVDATTDLVRAANALTGRLHHMLRSSRRAVVVVREHGVRREVIAQLNAITDDLPRLLAELESCTERTQAVFPNLMEPTLQLMMFRNLAYTLSIEWHWQLRTRFEGAERQPELLLEQNPWDRHDWARVFEGRDPDAGLIDELILDFSRRIDDWSAHILAGREPSEWWPARQRSELARFDAMIEREGHRLDAERRRELHAMRTRLADRLDQSRSGCDKGQAADTRRLASEAPGLVKDEDPASALASRLGYQSLQPHSWGGFGVLYRGIDMAGVVHAVKLLHPLPFGSGANAEARFRREAEALTRLEHPNIVRYQNLSRLDGSWVLQMDFVEGTTLSNWVRDGQVGHAEQIRAIITLLRAIQHAHERGVFHRDIKADNVLVRHDGTVVLVDFGLAWIAGCVDTVMTTRSTWSLDYAPPEVREDPEASRGANHDIYSIGVVLHQLLAGRRPTTAEPGPLPSELEAVRPVLARALAPLPSRFEHAAAFADALEAALAGVEQPWQARIAAAGQVQSALLREVLVAAADAGVNGEFGVSVVNVAGAFEALRIHVQRAYRIARGSDAPRHERVLPGRLSVCAAAIFREYQGLCVEPVLAVDRYGEAAIAAMGFGVTALGILQRCVATASNPQPRANALREQELLEAHTHLVERVVWLERFDPPLIAGFDAYERIEQGLPETDQQRRLDAEDEELEANAHEHAGDTDVGP